MNATETMTRTAQVFDLLRFLVETAAMPPAPVPAQPRVMDTAGFGLDAADSAQRIAVASAGLGTTTPEEDQQRAETILTETRKQIARIQQLYGLPAEPAAGATPTSP